MKMIQSATAARIFALLVVLLFGCGVNGQTTDGGGDTTPATSAPSGSPTMPPNAEWGGCVDPNTRNSIVTIGQKTTICLVVADGVDWQAKRTYMRLHFQPIADQYSRFIVPQSFKQLVLNGEEGNTQTDRVSQIFAGKNITVHAESGTALSFQKRYFDSFDKVYPHLTVIIDVQDGIVNGITWDDSCVFCSVNVCEPNVFDFNSNLRTQENAGQPVGGCPRAKEDCTLPKDGTGTVSNCDLLLYVVWTGTDSNGSAFTSSAYRFSAFPKQDLSDRLAIQLPELPEVSLPDNPFSSGGGDESDGGTTDGGS